jgi:hypothetical protein
VSALLDGLGRVALDASSARLLNYDVLFAELEAARRPARSVRGERRRAETALREWVQRAQIDAGQGPPGALATTEREELAGSAARKQTTASGA